MDDAEHRIAVLNGIDQHADRDQVKNLLERLLLEHHLAVDAVEMLGSAVNLVADIHFLDLVAQRADDRPDIGLALCALHANLHNQILISLGIQIAQTEILQLLLDLVYAQPVRQRRIDIQRLLRDALLSLG